MAKNDKDVSPLIEDLTRHFEESDPAAEELRKSLNGLIAKYNLHPSVVISLLARISAAYIHLTQKAYNQICGDEVVEEDFQNMLTAHLTDLDMSDVMDEMEKMKKEQLN